MMLTKNKSSRSSRFNRFVLAAAALSASASLPISLYGSTLADWNFVGVSNWGPSPMAPTSQDINLTVVGLTRGSGVTTTGTAAGNAWGGTGWDGATDVNGAISLSNYATFSFTTATGFQSSFSQIDPYNIRRSGTGPATGQWQYSLDGATFTNIGSAITWGTTTTASGNNQTTIDLSGIGALQNVAAGITVTFRVANWNTTTGSAGTWYFNGGGSNTHLILEGAVTHAAGGTSLFWTSDGATLGGSATWDSASNRWSASDTTVAGAAWDFSKTAVFKGTAGAVTVDAAGISANNNIQFNSSGYVLNGSGALTLGGATPSIFVTNSGDTATINAKISGSAGLTKQGPGMLILGNAGNDFTGSVTISSGGLSISNDGQLGNAGNSVVLGTSGTLYVTASINSARGFSGSGAINIAPGATFAATGSFNTSALTLSNSGTLDMQSSGTVGNIVFTAPGTLTSTNGQQINASGINASSLSGTATLSTTGVNLGTSAVSIDVGASGHLVLSANITLGAVLTKTGAGTLDLFGSNTELATMSIGPTGTADGGTININNPAALGANQIRHNHATLNATTDLTGLNALANGESIGGVDAGPSTFSGSPIEFLGTSRLFETSGTYNHINVLNVTTFSGSFTDGNGAGSGLKVDGGGTLVFNGDASAFTKPTIVLGGTTLAVNNAFAAPVTVTSGKLRGTGVIAGAVSVESGGTLAPGSSSATLTINNTLNLAGLAKFDLDATTAGLNTAGKVVGVTSLTYGGNLQVALAGGSFAVGQTWDLFDFSNQVGLFANNADFNTAGGQADGFLPALSSGVWTFDYTTGILAISASGGGTPAILLWTGGNASWDQSSANWENNTAGDTTWNNVVNGPATVASFNTPSTIAIDAAGVTANGLDFQNGSDGIVLNGTGSLTLNNASISVAAANTATINAQISGSLGINVHGGGKLVLASTSNNFTGNVIVNAATLSISDDRNLGNAANTVALSGATLQTTASINTARTISGTGSLDIASGTTLASTGSFNMTTLNLVNTGTLDLQASGANVGNLNFNAPANLTSSTGQSIAISGITATNLTGTATISTAGGIDLGAATKTIDVGATGTLVLAAPITLTGSANGSLKKTGAGTLELTAANPNLFRVQIGSASIATPVDGGVVKINNNQALGANQVFLNDGTLNATTNLTGANALAIGVSLGGLDNGPANLAGSNIEFTGASGLFQQTSAPAQNHLTVNNTTILGGTFSSGTGLSTGLTIDGTGKLIVNGDASTMTLPTTLSATLVVNNAWAGAITVNAGTLAGHGTIGGAVTAGSAPHTIAPSAGLAPSATGTLTLAALTTNSHTTLGFNLVTPANSDAIHIIGNLNTTAGGSIAINDLSAPQGYYKVLQVDGSMTGISALTVQPSALPAGQAYILDTHHDAGFVDIHKVLIGDANGDNIVDGADFDTWFTHLLTSTSDYSQGDFNGDGLVDGADFDIWFTHLLNTFTPTESFGVLPSDQTTTFTAPSQFAGGESVPEPASLAVLGVGLAALFARRRSV